MEHLGEMSIISRVLCILPREMKLSTLGNGMVSAIEIECCIKSKEGHIHIELMACFFKAVIC